MSQPPPMLILFDAAGTLIELAEPVEDVYVRCFAKWGWRCERASLKKAFPEAFRAVPEPVFPPGADGDPIEREWWRQVVRQVVEASGRLLEGERFDDCFVELFDHFAHGNAWRPFPEVRKVLTKLKRDGVQLAVVSNFDRRLHRVLRELELTNYFDLVLTSADVGARKPSPLLLHEAVGRLAAEGRKICMVGDSMGEDGGAAAAAGVDFFLLNRPHSTLLNLQSHLDEIFPAKSAC